MRKLIYKGRTSLAMTQGAEYTEVSRNENGKVWIYDDFDQPRRMSADLFDPVRDASRVIETRIALACALLCALALLLILL